MNINGGESYFFYSSTKLQLNGNNVLILRFLLTMQDNKSGKQRMSQDESFCGWMNVILNMGIKEPWMKQRNRNNVNNGDLKTIIVMISRQWNSM